MTDYRYEKHGTELTVTADYLTIGNEDDGYVEINTPTVPNEVRDLINAILDASGTSIMRVDLGTGRVKSIAKES